MKNENLKAALDYLLIHNTSVIPVGKNKRPLIAWKEFQTRLPTKEEVILWFSFYPDAQVGIVTGRLSNLTVVDIEKGGDPSFLPQNTPIIQTGSGGYHYYFLYEEGVNNYARIKPLIDIRSEGGYVIAPPSVSDKGKYTVLRRANYAPFPRELFGLEAKKGGALTVSAVTVDEYPGYGEGRRNDEMTRFIGSVLTRIHPTDWDALAWPIIQGANLKNNPPLPESELKASFKSIWSAEKRNNADRWNKKSNFVEVNISIPAWQSVTDDEVVLMSEAAAAQAKKFEEVIPLGYEIFDNATRGGTTAGDLIIVSAQTGHGKTSMCQSFTKNFLINNKKVLWFSYEVMIPFLWEKFVVMGIGEKDFCFVPFKHTTGDVGWIEKKIKEAKEKFNTKIVCIDHLGYLMPKLNPRDISKNYSAYITQIVRELKTLAIKEEIVIILPVHMRKTDDPDINDIRDSSGVAQEADLVFIMERQKNSGDDAELFFYSNYTKITLAKNRKTGKTVIGKFLMKNDYFEYDPVKSIERSLPKTKGNGKMYKKKGNYYEKDDFHDDPNDPIFGKDSGYGLDPVEKTPFDDDSQKEEKKEIEQRQINFNEKL